MTNPHAYPQRLPQHQTTESQMAYIQDEVIGDITIRQKLAEGKYHTKGLLPLDGRNPLVDLYQENLDALLYLKSSLVYLDRVREVANDLLSSPTFDQILDQYPTYGSQLKALLWLLLEFQQPSKKS